MDGPFRLTRNLIRVSGPEAVRFLDNLLTQHVERLGEVNVLYAALLSPQGKIICDMLLWRDGDGVIVEADPLRAADLLRRLTLYKLRARIEIEDVTDRFRVLYSPRELAGGSADPRFPDGTLGWRRLAPHAEMHAAPDGDASFAARRLAVGVPDLARDAAAEEVFALEALLDELHGVDFSKGCFVGQENVSRMKRRATTRKKFCPIVFEGPAPPFAATVTAGELDIGTVRTGAPGRAMALLRLDRAAESLAKGLSLKVDGRDVRLDPPPWLALPAREQA